MIQIINPIYLSKLWPSILEGLKEVLEDMNKEIIHELWVPEDIYTGIKTGELQLWYGEEGFVITTIYHDKYDGTRIFLVWIGYSFDKNIPVLEWAQQILEDYAKANMCSLMKFYSTRKGFNRKAKDIGYVVGPTTYVKRI